MCSSESCGEVVFAVSRRVIAVVSYDVIQSFVFLIDSDWSLAMAIKLVD